MVVALLEGSKLSPPASLGCMFRFFLVDLGKWSGSSRNLVRGFQIHIEP